MKDLNEVRSNIIQLLLLTNSADKTYGLMMFLLMVINYPMNAFLIINLIIKSLSLANVILISVIITYQLSFIFVFHMASTRYTGYIHNPAKFIIHKYNQIQFNSLRDHLKTSFWLERFHTKNPYGVTYGRTNLITKAAFLTVSFFTL